MNKEEKKKDSSFIGGLVIGLIIGIIIGNIFFANTSYSKKEYDAAVRNAYEDGREDGREDADSEYDAGYERGYEEGRSYGALYVAKTAGGAFGEFVGSNDAYSGHGYDNIESGLGEYILEEASKDVQTAFDDAYSSGYSEAYHTAEVNMEMQREIGMYGY